MNGGLITIKILFIFTQNITELLLNTSDCKFIYLAVKVLYISNPLLYRNRLIMNIIIEFYLFHLAGIIYALIFSFFTNNKITIKTALTKKSNRNFWSVWLKVTGKKKRRKL